MKTGDSDPFNENLHDNHVHTRNDSVYSMDSFVAEQPDSGDNENIEKSEFEYISPSSSSAVSIDSWKIQNSTDDAVDREQNSLLGRHFEAPSVPDTEDDERGNVAFYSASVRPDSIERKRSTLSLDSGENPSGDSIPNVPPVHSFFNQPYFQVGMDDAVENGSLVSNQLNDSLVFHQQQEIAVSSQSKQDQSNLITPTKTTNPERDRFPSFDSVGSSGSLVRMAQSKSSAKPPPTASVPRILPYHERRKLMQQRQKQQQQRSQIGRQDPVPPRPDRGQQQVPVNLPYGIPTLVPPGLEHLTGQVDTPNYQTQNQLLAGITGYPSHIYPPLPPYHGLPMPPASGIPFMSNFSIGGYQAPYPPQPFIDRNAGSFRSAGIPPDRPSSVSSSNASSKSRASSHGEKQLNQVILSATNESGRPPLQPMNQQIIVSESPEATPPQSGSSFDSSDDNIIENDVLLGNRTKSVVRPPPPPPPPIPPPPQSSSLARQDSERSVSSLGSIDKSYRDDTPGEKQHPTSNIFQRLNPFKAKVLPSTDSPADGQSVIDFRRQSNAFLSTVERHNKQQNQVAMPSPKDTSRRGQLSSMATPPPSRGGHRRLHSINNDDWTEGSENNEQDSPFEELNRKEDPTDIKRRKPGMAQLNSAPSTASVPTDRQSNRSKVKAQDRSMYVERSSMISSSDATDDHDEDDDSSSNYGEVSWQADESTMLLPPTGISSNEYYDGRIDYGANRTRKPKTTRRGLIEDDFLKPNLALRGDVANELESEERSKRRRRKKKKKKHHRRKKRAALPLDDIGSSSSISSSSASSRKPHHWKQKRVAGERKKLLAQWKAEARKKEEASRRLSEERAWYRRLARHLDSEGTKLLDNLFQAILFSESFFGNLPLMIGAIALAIANLGVVWFKFSEENLSSCQRVHFHSAQCTFPEFPGCFYCDTNAIMYKVALNFHFACSTIAGVLAFTFFAKLIIARSVVYDELSNPTMAAPAGLVCMTLAIVFAGHGMFGMCVVLIAAFIHFCVALWFIYLALAYHMMPDPSWFPNTVGIGICAVKTWLYYPVLGKILMVISLSLNVLFFPLSLIRVSFNEKIPATIAWMQMTAPDISLYALTIMAQPTFEEEFPDINTYQKVHRMLYLPCMHVLFGICIVGMVASISGVAVRWHEFRKVPFSPAHAAFCCPILSHANAVQAYRASIISFSSIPDKSLFRDILYSYWVTVLMCGTVVTIWITTKFFLNLAVWTQFDVDGEIEPPAPYETAMTITDMVSAGEAIVQPYVSPAVLQANETGTLVLVRGSQGQRFVRTRQVTALGFQPIMNVIQLEVERELLLDWVGKNRPRRRHRTLSVPGIDFSYGTRVGSRQSGDSTFDVNAPWTHRPRTSV